MPYCGPAALPHKKRQKMDAGRDPLKGGFVRAPKRGDASLTEAEAAAAKIKVKVRLAVLTCPPLQLACFARDQNAIIDVGIWQHAVLSQVACAADKRALSDGNNSSWRLQRKPGDKFVPKKNVRKHKGRRR